VYSEQIGEGLLAQATLGAVQPQLVPDVLLQSSFHLPERCRPATYKSTDL